MNNHIIGEITFIRGLIHLPRVGCDQKRIRFTFRPCRIQDFNFRSNDFIDIIIQKDGIFSTHNYNLFPLLVVIWHSQTLYCLRYCVCTSYSAYIANLFLWGRNFLLIPNLFFWLGDNERSDDREYAGNGNTNEYVSSNGHGSVKIKNTLYYDLIIYYKNRVLIVLLEYNDWLVLLLHAMFLRQVHHGKELLMSAYLRQNQYV